MTVQRGVAATVAAVLALAGCSSDDGPGPRSAPPEMELSLTQLLPEEGTSHALLRVINRETEPLTVTAVGLDWSGWGDVITRTDGEKVVPAESELMLRFELPEPSCEPTVQTVGDVEGQVVVDGRLVAQPLTDPAQVYARRLWRTQCDRLLLGRSLDLGFVGARQVAGPGGDLVATALVLRRRDGSEPIDVVATGGSVLYDLRLTGTTTMPPAVDATRIPLAILPGNRCDEHAIGQATAPYDFSLTLRIGEQRVREDIRPPLAVQNAASEMLLRHCGEPRR